MRLIVTLLFISQVLISIGQDYSLHNSSLSEDLQIVYRGFKNNIQFNAPQKDAINYSLSVTNASIVREGDHHILKPGKGKIVYINIMAKIGEATLNCHKDSFIVMNLPDPSIYINGELSTGKLSGDLKYARVQYKPDVPLDSKFTVKGWQLLIDGELYFGKNDRFPQLVNDAIAKLSSGSIISLKLDVEGPDGITRRIGKNLTKD